MIPLSVINDKRYGSREPISSLTQAGLARLDGYPVDAVPNEPNTLEFALDELTGR